MMLWTPFNNHLSTITDLERKLSIFYVVSTTNEATNPAIALLPMSRAAAHLFGDVCSTAKEIYWFCKILKITSDLICLASAALFM